VDTTQDPSPDDLADAWRRLVRAKIGRDRLASLVAAIRLWPTGRLDVEGIVVSWQRVRGSVYVTLR
jgi:hypothetical protein